ncbi:hypothetical protein [Quadrisphaera sp. KR29]|uniref:hypothetical protein n=1 Tax=Quadrisphaera sp. KR29 TaxID=3461391 RepID=UPI00404460F3
MTSAAAAPSPPLLPEDVSRAARCALSSCTAAAATAALDDLGSAQLCGAERLLLTLDPSEPGASAVLEALREAAGPDRVTTRAAGASVLVDVDLDAS